MNSLEDDMKKLWGQIAMNELCVRLGISKSHMYKIRKQLGLSLGVRKRGQRYSFNEKAFDVLTPEGAYWCGFLTADGYIEKAIPKIRGPKLSLNQGPKDFWAVKAFGKWMNYSGKIYTSDKEYRVDLRGSEHLIRRLDNLGVTYDKTKRWLSPELESSEFLFAWLRGSLDGDGSVIYTKARGYRHVHLILPKAIAGRIQELLPYRWYEEPITEDIIKLRLLGIDEVNDLWDKLSKAEGVPHGRKIN